MPLNRRETLGLLAGSVTLMATRPVRATQESTPVIETPLPPFANLLELETLASKVIPKPAFDYIARGAGDEQTLRENRDAFSRVFIDQRVLTGKTVQALDTLILGSLLKSPLVVATMAAHGLVHTTAESGSARGAAAYGTLLEVSAVSTQNLEQIAAASNGDKWFQCYLTRDVGFNRELLQRAQAAGYTAIVLTADVTVGGNREQDRRNALCLPIPGNFLDRTGRPRAINRVFENRLGPDSLDFVRQHSGGLPLVLKGVTTAADARLALRHGVDAIQVSNHGGRQLDGSPAAFDSLLRVAAEVQGQVPIIFDSGIRRGLDVFKALAAGADAVAIGRPVLYGLSLGGWQGVHAVLEHLESELRTVMQLAGAATLADIRATPLLNPDGSPLQQGIRS
ncbi:alpha-hydroxy-acid oxidizing protein [Pseudomonas sp. ABC1]|uniref:alpha-hydroxy-acid oxidizing protein n=1 Tax=Pseudomonas sp. ABC1 TaxID=2748080 RepID=UPI001C4DF4ED|nr:alpha-hydroxy-acid oxidizing protein [Pseudomonas sp. ABC1]